MPLARPASGNMHGLPIPNSQEQSALSFAHIYAEPSHNRN
jgi:hypothetical protein